MALGAGALALLGAASGVITNIWNAKEAARNRRFQERMSSTAHQREVKDLRAAGINPMLSRMGAGASTPGGDRAPMEDVGGKVSSAAIARAQLRLIDAQARREDASARLANTQATDISNTAAAGRLKAITSQADLADLNVQQARNLLPVQLETAKAELQRTLSSAKGLEAAALLDEAALAGARNIEALQKRFEELAPLAGPASRMLFEMLRLIGGRRR